ncbi:MAG: hypothetical protein WCP77_22470, partial [Roseococcus sp.]
METTPRYGVRITNEAKDALDVAEETLRLLGYAVVESGHSPSELAALSAQFQAIQTRSAQGRLGELRQAAGDGEILRCPLSQEPAFLALAANPTIMALCERLIGPGFILNQQNGIVN